MLKKLKLEKPRHGKIEITPEEAVRIQHDSHYVYPFSSYVDDLMLCFEATREEAEAIVRKELNLPQ
jgi:hypothetical protein